RSSGSRPAMSQTGEDQASETGSSRTRPARAAPIRHPLPRPASLPRPPTRGAQVAESTLHEVRPAESYIALHLAPDAQWQEPAANPLERQPPVFAPIVQTRREIARY